MTKFDYYYSNPTQNYYFSFNSLFSDTFRKFRQVRKEGNRNLTRELPLKEGFDLNFIKSILSFFTKSDEQHQENQNSTSHIQDQNIIYYVNNCIIDENTCVKFYMDNREYINPLKEELLNFSMRANEKIIDIDTTISDCKKTLELFEKLKNYCYKTLLIK